jgi:hypothetical protein
MIRGKPEYSGYPAVTWSQVVTPETPSIFVYLFGMRLEVNFCITEQTLDIHFTSEQRIVIWVLQ